MMNEEKKTESAASSQRRWSTSEGIAIGENPPSDWAHGIAAFQRIQDMAIVPEHEGQVSAMVRDCVRRLNEAASRHELTGEVYKVETAKLEHAVRFGGFRTHVKVDEMTKKGAALARTGYSGGECDIIRGLVADGSEIEDGFDAEHIVIGGRLYSRYSLREAGRPQSWTNVAAWHSQFPLLEGKK